MGWGGLLAVPLWNLLVWSAADGCSLRVLVGHLIAAGPAVPAVFQVPPDGDLIGVRSREQTPTAATAKRRRTSCISVRSPGAGGVQVVGSIKPAYREKAFQTLPKAIFCILWLQPLFADVMSLKARRFLTPLDCAVEAKTVVAITDLGTR